MTKEWPHDGSYPWVHARRGDIIVIEWHDHLFELTPENVAALIEALQREVELLQKSSPERRP